MKLIYYNKKYQLKYSNIFIGYLPLQHKLSNIYGHKKKEV